LTSGDGYKIVGGGFIVSPVGDVDGDGLSDVMITNAVDWVHNKNIGGLAITFSLSGRRFSRSPTRTPSSRPSLQQHAPSAVPSSIPSGSTSNDDDSITHCPSSVPSASPSISPQPTRIQFQQPTDFSSTAAPAVVIITRSPTVKPTRKPSVSPSLRPSAIPSPCPSYLPTILPSFRPTVVPTVAPSTRVPSVKPSRSPTFVPSFNLNPSFSPSFIPTYPPDLPFIDKAINKGGFYNATSVIQHFIIDSSASVALLGSNGRNKYTILHHSNMTITILNFHLSSDVIDLSRYSPSISALQYLSYKTYPLTFLLEGQQNVIFSSYDEFELSEENFIFSTSSSSETTVTTAGVVDFSMFTPNVITTISVFGGLFSGIYIFFQYLKSKIRKEKEKKKKLAALTRKENVKAVKRKKKKEKVIPVVEEEDDDSDEDSDESDYDSDYSDDDDEDDDDEDDDDDDDEDDEEESELDKQSVEAMARAIAKAQRKLERQKRREERSERRKKFAIVRRRKKRRKKMKKPNPLKLQLGVPFSLNLEQIAEESGTSSSDDDDYYEFTTDEEEVKSDTGSFSFGSSFLSSSNHDKDSFNDASKGNSAENYETYDEDDYQQINNDIEAQGLPELSASFSFVESPSPSPLPIESAPIETASHPWLTPSSPAPLPLARLRKRRSGKYGIGMILSSLDLSDDSDLEDSEESLSYEESSIDRDETMKRRTSSSFSDYLRMKEAEFREQQEKVEEGEESEDDGNDEGSSLRSSLLDTGDELEDEAMNKFSARYTHPHHVAVHSLNSLTDPEKQFLSMFQLLLDNPDEDNHGTHDQLDETMSSLDNDIESQLM
jgi:hypothetical protein